MKPGPQRIANILADLMARRGYGRVQSMEAYDAAWREAAGPLIAEHSQVGMLRRGTLEVLVANSALVQELTFQKAQLVKKLAQLLPDQGIRGLKFKVGQVT
jgi:predicted nucleic acid-binding Zn ribbon protein